MSRLDDNTTLGVDWDAEPSPRRTLKPAAVHGARDPLDAVDDLPRLDPAALRIGATLGQGGMGVVRVAVQTSLGREVAVKSLRPDHDSPDARRKLLQEAWVTGALEHPNVVPVYEIGRDDGDRPYLVMKRISGEAWSALVADPASLRERTGTADPLEWHMRVLLQVCNAIAFAHARGIVHRDLKPDNVMIGPYGEVYVVDWGIAVALDDSPVDRVPRATDQRSPAGTPAYMAPEQLSAVGLSERTDVYLLGGLLYHVLHGHPPHEPEPRDGPTALEAILERVRTTDPTIDPELPAGLGTVLAQALARRPEDRFATVDAFRAAVTRWLDRRGLAALLASADADRASLVALVAGPADAVDVLARLGACRFAYGRVLDADPDHGEARRGLDEALLAAARWRLGAGDWAAADLLAREASAVPDDLGGALALARGRADDDRERLRRLEDERTGVRTRVTVIFLVGVLWTFCPLVLELAGVERTHARLFAEGLLISFVGAGLAAWANDSLSKSVINRRIQAMIVLAPAMMPLTATGMWALGVPGDALPVVLFLVFTAMAATYAAMVDLRLWPIAASYAAAFLVCAFVPAASPVALAATGAVVTLGLLRIGWRDFVSVVRAEGL